tara:strand:+ start:574 stop:864 length:291 start_codon:yes stop_codon:yes gene_type:complete
MKSSVGRSTESMSSEKSVAWMSLNGLMRSLSATCGSTTATSQKSVGIREGGMSTWREAGKHLRQHDEDEPEEREDEVEEDEDERKAEERLDARAQR